MGVKSKVIRVKQLVREPSGGVDIGGGLGNTRDYYYTPYEHEGEEKVRELFEDDWGEIDPREFQIKYLEIDGPHAGDPIFQDAQDVGHGLKIQDPSDCEIWAWDWPFDSDGDISEALWVQLTFCRPGFEGGEEWDYWVTLMKGEGDDVETVDADDWAEARRAIQTFRQRSSGEALSDLAEINRHRRQLGMGPLDPGAGWTGDELKQMAESIRTTGKMYNPQRAATLKRRLTR